MKRFEHEVLTFAPQTPKGVEAMRDALGEWGAAGFEVVSVVQATPLDPMTVFLTRTVDTSSDEQDMP